LLQSGRRTSGGPCVRCLLSVQKLLNRLLVKGLGLALHDPQGTGRTFSKAVAQTVTVLFPDQAGLPVNYLNRSLFTGRNALPASIAQLFIDFYNLPRSHIQAPLWNFCINLIASLEYEYSPKYNPCLDLDQNLSSK
jgi:hypothetical protein